MIVMRRLRQCWPSHTRQKEQEKQVGSQAQEKSTAKSVKRISISLASSSDGVLDEALLKSGDSFLFDNIAPKELPPTQSQLQLDAVGRDFSLIGDAPLPRLTQDEEVLIQVNTVGLNPIDWKAPAFGWGLPTLPCVLGRDLVGTIVKSTSHSDESASNIGSVVGVISTDYRDYRKAAFQEYAIAPLYNLYRIPLRYKAAQRELASLGVAFVAAALAFGVCLGGRLEHSNGDTVDLLGIARGIPAENLPEDVRHECANVALHDLDRPNRGDWVLIWGGGSTVGFILVQLAKLSGLKVICVADAVKSGSMLVNAGADVIVHRKDVQEAAKIIAGVTKEKELRYGIDTVGKDTAGLVRSALRGQSTRSRHIVGLVGLPKTSDQGRNVEEHKVPIKLFHEVPAVGKALMGVLEDLLQNGRLILPKVHKHERSGLQNVNTGLQLLRSGEFDAQRVVVTIR